MRNRKPVFKSNTLLLAAATISLLLAFFSCNPVKKVLKNPRLTEEVVAEWRKGHPLETAQVVIPGRDTVILKEKVIYDSVPLPYPVNHRYTEIRYQDRLVTDTVYIRDTAMIGLLLRKIDAQEKVISELSADVKSLRGFKTGIIYLSVLAVLIIAVALLVRFKILRI